MPESIPLSEIFCSIQGEGQRMGMPAVFVRLWGCNLSCAFCDSRFAWDKSVEPPRAVSLVEIGETIRGYPTKNLIFTGGEPMLHQGAIRAICEHVDPDFVEIETNGTIKSEIADLVDQLNVSPKFDFKNPIVIEPGEKIFWKFVIRDEHDLEQADCFCAERNIPFEKVSLQPEGKTRTEIQRTSALTLKATIDRGAHFSPRLHVLLWDEKRGV